jgi:serine/threonine protein kinase
MTLPPITQIDDYASISQLGRGDFATVFRVRREAQEYALKLCHDGGDAARMRLRNEGEVLKQLKHRAIPRFVKAGVWEERPYLVMSLMRGITLKAALKQRQDDGSIFGDIEALRAIHLILEAVAYMHGKGIVHRDIKDANVLITAAGNDVALLDFGFSKHDGETEIRSSDSFWRVGAARFSPPTKLEHPALANASHDVFAVGVLAYLMVTGTHPWNAPPEADVSRVRELQARPAKPVTELNSRISSGVAQFIAALIQTNDQDRPSSAEAAATAKELLRTVVNAAGTRSQISGRIQLPHVTRDPIYGDIRLTDDEWAVLDCPELQRLRWIKQLGLANLVYVGAEHSRLSHTLGCLYRVEQILSAIEDIEGVTIDRETRLTARMYALSMMCHTFHSGTRLRMS